MAIRGQWEGVLRPPCPPGSFPGRGGASGPEPSLGAPHGTGATSGAPHGTGPSGRGLRPGTYGLGSPTSCPSGRGVAELPPYLPVVFGGEGVSPSLYALTSGATPLPSGRSGSVRPPSPVLGEAQSSAHFVRYASCGSTGLRPFGATQYSRYARGPRAGLRPGPPPVD